MTPQILNLALYDHGTRSTVARGPCGVMACMRRLLDMLAEVSVAFYKALFPWQTVLNERPP